MKSTRILRLRFPNLEGDNTIECSFETALAFDLPLQDRCLQKIAPSCKNNLSSLHNIIFNSFRLILYCGGCSGIVETVTSKDVTNRKLLASKSLHNKRTSQKE